jgi:hypothetical protein
MRDRQVSKRHAAAGVGAAEDSETRTSCYLTGERGERPRWCREELWAPCSGYTRYTARYWGLFFARVIHRESRVAIYLSFVRASFCALGAAPSHLSIYTAARGQLSINYPERGRMRSALARVGGSGRRGTTVALLQLVERRTDKTHQTGPLLTQSVTGVVELPRRQILPDRRLDGTALSVAPQGELRSERPSMEIGVTVRKHDEASANEVTR